MTYRWFDKLADAIAVRDVMRKTALRGEMPVDATVLLDVVGDRGANRGPTDYETRVLLFLAGSQ